MYERRGDTRRRSGTADSDNPSRATIERRREADLAFISFLRTASPEQLIALKSQSKGWRLVALERQLAKLGIES